MIFPERLLSGWPISEMMSLDNLAGHDVFSRGYTSYDVTDFELFNRTFTAVYSGRELERLWPEEEKALEDIMNGTTKMILQTGEDFLKELNDVLDE